ILIIGPIPVITATKTLARRDMYLMTSSATRTSMTTVTGNRIPATAMSGTPTSRPAGLLIVKGTGHGSFPWDGLGWMMNPGATLHSITAGGFRFEAAGAGSLDQQM